MSASEVMTDFVCPRCKESRYKRLALPHPAVILWVINPGVVVNELLFGQRVPRVTYICIRCDQPRVLRQYVRCPSCGRFHNGLIWGKGNAFGHWFGLFCPDCGVRIPTLLNAWSILVVGVTFPIWYPIWRVVRTRWIEFERSRARRVLSSGAVDHLPVKNWIIRGALGFGLPMWIVMSLTGLMVFPSGVRGSLPPLAVVLMNLPVWLLAGAGWGFLMKRIMGRLPRFR